jgi:shikimate kinase
MKLPKEFENYVREGVIRKTASDKPRAEFLIKESQISLEGLRERINIIGINDRNANSIIKDSYDIIMEVIRAKLLLAGYSSSGSYAHEGEISYLKELGFPDIEISFLNELRYFRNGVMYYGKILDKEYAQKVFSFLGIFKEKIKPFVIIILGPLGIEKTTIANLLAKGLDAEYFSIDSILEQEGLDKIDEKQGCIPVCNFIKANEKITPKITEFLFLNKSVIIDGNFYHKEQLDHLVNTLSESKVYIFTLKAPLPTCIHRDKERKHSYGKCAAEAVYKLVSRFDYGVIINTEDKTEKEVVEEIKKKLK